MKRLTIVFAVCLCLASFCHGAGSNTLNQGMVTISMDAEGGYISLYAAKVLTGSKLPATVYVVSDMTGDGEHPTWDQVEGWHVKNGWEIGSHSFRHDHLLTWTADQIRADFAAAIAEFEDHGFTNVVAFAPPYGESNPELKEITAESGFTSLRNVKTADGPALNDVATFDPWSVAVSDMRNFTTFADVKLLIDQAVVEGKWLVISLQGMSKVPSQRDIDMSQKVFKKVVKYVKKLRAKHQLQVVTTTEGVTIMEDAQSIP